MPEPQTLTGTSKVALYSNLVRLPHTAFALPFAVVGVLFASYRYPVTAAQIAWIVVAFTAARFAAMAHNRVIDRDYDARNPRTAERELPAGKLSLNEARVSIAVASAVLFLAAAMLNWLVLALAPVALAVLLSYSYLKRFTSFTHLGLGIADGIAPAAAYLAISARWSDPWYLLPVLALAVAFWVAGFDVLYALQDVEVDRAEGLHSIPARHGQRAAIWYSRAFQSLAVVFLIAAGLVVPEPGLYYYIGVAFVGIALIYEHSLVKPDDLSRLNAAFFNVNALISAVFCLFVLVDRVWR